RRDLITVGAVESDPDAARGRSHTSSSAGRRHHRRLSAMSYPQRRMRRLRTTPAMRRLVAETRLGVDDLVAPLFVREGIDEPQPIASLPGVVQHTRESLRKEVR